MELVYLGEKMDFTSILGFIIGTAMLLGGQIFEGSSISQLMQVTAAMIVLGGTLGAVIISFPASQLKDAIIYLKDVYLKLKIDYEETISEIITYAAKARREGLIALEKDAQSASDSLLKLGLDSVADGVDPVLVKEMLETQLVQLESNVNGASKVWESAGAYAPTFGIIGAVMGLIQVMQNLSDPTKLGTGIAVAFVATIYGLFAANLVFIPISTKIRTKYAKVFTKKELIIEGILSIQAGESPTLIERKLNAFVLDKHLAKSE